LKYEVLKITFTRDNKNKLRLIAAIYIYIYMSNRLKFKQTKSADIMIKIYDRDKVYLIQPYVIMIVITYGISEIFSGYSIQNAM